jgi:hypothetical protein
MSDHSSKSALRRVRRVAFAVSAPVLGLAILSVGLAPSKALACACGCSVFDVGSSTLLPSGQGGTVFLEWDYLNQSRNWSGSHRAPADDNDDKKIRSSFFLAGGQYMFNSSWGAMVEVPMTERYVDTTEADNPGSFKHFALGDIRIMGVYSGFSPDMSTGIMFGLKLPTGGSTYPNFGADVQIGTGSTDVMLGAYHRGQITVDGSWSYFGQLLWQHEITTQHDYKPGYELNGSAGISYNNIKIGTVDVTPIFHVIVSRRGRDGGLEGETDDTGYTRVLLSPGISIAVDRWKFYADVEIATWQHVNGNQLVAPTAFKVILSRSF